MKTKHIILVFVGLVWLALQFTQAQFTTYSFQNRANGQYLSVAEDKSGITLAQKTVENRLNQYFILKPRKFYTTKCCDSTVLCVNFF